MPLWGTDPSSATNIPKYLSDSEDVKYNKGDAYANEHGWVMKAGSAATGNSNTSAAPEILVAISGLAGITTDGIAVQGYGPAESSLVLDSTDGTANAGDKVLLEMGGGLQFPTATQVRFVTTSHTNGTSKTMTVEISFDEEITVDGTGGTPQIVLANGNQSTDGDGNATTYTSVGVSTVKVDSKILVISLIIALIIFILDYIIPIYTSKKFGASKFGIIGASIGTLVGLFLPPFGIIFGALIGAIAGELFLNKNFEKSIKAAVGVFLGLIVSGFTKALISIVFLVIYINLFLNNFSNLF